MKKEIQESNGMIAEFMGLKHGWWIAHEKREKTYCDLNGTHEIFGSRAYFNRDLQFHSDWCWLMAVVDKIESLKFHPRWTVEYRVIIKNKFCQIDIGEGTIGVEGTLCGIGQDRKEAVYKAVVKFIGWYSTVKREKSNC